MSVTQKFFCFLFQFLVFFQREADEALAAAGRAALAAAGANQPPAVRAVMPPPNPIPGSGPAAPFCRNVSPPVSK
jgi:hypothetical protein